MPTGTHIADRLQALLQGALPEDEREQAEAHLAACAPCSEERDLLTAAWSVIAPLPATEPRPGFAVRVALHARDAQIGAGLGRWLRFTVGGVVAAGVAAVALIIAIPPAPMHSHEVMLAQRLDLLEDMDVVQNQQALEDLDVVEVLHKLEARP